MMKKLFLILPLLIAVVVGGGLGVVKQAKAGFIGPCGTGYGTGMMQSSCSEAPAYCGDDEAVCQVEACNSCPGGMMYCACCAIGTSGSATGCDYWPCSDGYQSSNCPCIGTC